MICVLLLLIKLLVFLSMDLGFFKCYLKPDWKLGDSLGLEQDLVIGRTLLEYVL